MLRRPIFGTHFMHTQTTFRKFIFFGIPIAAMAIWAAAQARADGKDAQAAVAQAAAALYEGIRTETLDNGLRVYLKPVPSSPVVTTMVAYKVGSADEDLDNTGLSHYLE